MRAALWLRVSHERGDQTTENQRRALTEWAERRGLSIVLEYNVAASAWRGAHQKSLSQAHQDARRGRFDVLLIWALDRLSREGALAILEIVHRFGKEGVQVWSLQEPWTEVGGEMLEMLLALTGWVAKMESTRRSERTKSGLDRLRADGKTLGRPPGSKDKVPRKKGGYFLRYLRDT